MRKFFLRLRSVLKWPGPRRESRGTVPNVVALPAGTNSLDVRHRTVTALAPHCFGTVCERREYGNVLHIFAKIIKLKSAQKLYEVFLFLRS